MSGFLRQVNILTTGSKELSGVSLRRMLDILAEHGVKGNVKMMQQVKALDFAKSL
ncbi:MAG: hypothetical protein N2V75_09535 [Methanophagales archaeon]|nr:hypothetical protein [Methanophagales archaeon]